MSTETLTAASEIGRLFIDYLGHVRRLPKAERKHPFGCIEISVLDAISSLAESVPVMAADCDSLTRILRECLTGAASEERMAEFNRKYGELELRILPVCTELRRHLHEMHGLTRNHSLLSIGMDRLRSMELEGRKDPNMKGFMDRMLRRLNQINPVQDVVGYSQVFEIYGEAAVYSLLNRHFDTERVEETATSTPDFRCSFNGKCFYVEVKSFDIAGGEIRHRVMMEEGLDPNIELEAQVKSGRRVSTALSVVAPFRKPREDKDYDPRSLIRVIDTIRDKAKAAFKESQFSLGPTIAVSICDRLLIPGGDLSLLPHYRDFPEGGSAVSGVLWHACFGRPEIAIDRHPDFEGAPSLEGYLSKAGLYTDEADAFPGIAFVAMELNSNEPGIFGLFDNGYRNPVGWSACDTEGVLARLCTAFNDKDNSRADAIARRHRDAPQ